jgi:hypothetical protein
MSTKKMVADLAKWSAAAVGIAGASYATDVATTWLRYGDPGRGSPSERDPVLDVFLPQYDVADRHSVHIAAPAEVAIATATEMNIESSAIIRGIFKGREWILRSHADNSTRPDRFLAQMKSLGWGVLAELPGRELVMGGATKPWEPNPVFRAIPADEFSSFAEPGYVKIVWTLRAQPVGNNECVFRTETRAVATDPEARKRFRPYWSFLSLGIVAIRRVILAEVKAEAERRWRWSLAA